MKVVPPVSVGTSAFQSVRDSKTGAGSYHREASRAAAAEDRVSTAETASSSVTYEGAAVGRDEATVARLMQESESINQRLRSLVTALLRQQGITVDRLYPPEGPMQIDGNLQVELEALLGPEGDLGVEATSDRIIDFAKALSGGDPSRGEELREAIIQGFREAEGILGRLPEISRQTFDRVMEKLDAWTGEA